MQMRALQMTEVRFPDSCIAEKSHAFAAGAMAFSLLGWSVPATELTLKPLPHPSRLSFATVLCAAVLALSPAAARAQHHGHFHVVAAPVYFGYGYGFGYGYYNPFWWGYGGFYPYGWYAPYYRPTNFELGLGSARLQMKPRDAEVYVDGYIAGLVDDFDGMFQRLDVPAGQHEVVVYRDGYRTFTEKVLFRPGGTVNIKSDLQPLAPGESSGPRPEAPETRQRPAPRAGEPAGDEPREPTEFGSLAVRIQPADATLLVDGEEWTASEGTAPIVLELREGSHAIEIRKEGFATFRRTVRIRAGETLPLNVSLSR
jgi:PEGA domain-containing protein